MYELDESSDGLRANVATYLGSLTRILSVLVLGVTFGGLWIDFTTPGQVVLPMFVVTRDPYPNSGLLVAAIVLFVVTIGVAGLSSLLEESGEREPENQTQEWVVDVGSSNDS